MAQTTLYNNPYFASGLGQLVQSFIGDPARAAQAEYYASEAGLNNDTRQYRADIGTHGTANDLGSMLVSALQAGREYSSEAPEITKAILNTPHAAGGLADMLAAAGPAMGGAVGGGWARGGGGGRRGGGGGGGGAAPGKFKPLSAGGRTLLLRSLGDGVDPSTAMGIVAQTEGLMRDQGMGENDAINYALGNLDRGPDEVTNPGGTGLSRLVAEYTGLGGDPSTWAPDEATPGPVTGIKPPGAAEPAGQPDTADVIEQARQAIAAGRDRAAVIARLKQMGIDPAGL